MRRHYQETYGRLGMGTVLARIVVCTMMALAVVASAATERYSYSLNHAIPDGSAIGVVDARNVISNIRRLSAVRVKLNVSGQYNGDLYAYVRQVSAHATNFCVLLNRPGRSADDAVGYGDAGLSITLDSAAPIDIHAYRSVVTPPAGEGLTGSWQPDGRSVSPLAAIDTSGRNTDLDSFIGSDGSGEWTLFIADLDSGATNMLAGWELELVGAIDAPLSWAAPDPILYGTSLGSAQLNASAEGVVGNFVYTPPQGAILGAGSNHVLSVTFTPADTTNYVAVSSTVALTVMRAPLAVSATSTNRLYGTANPVFDGVITGIKNGDAIRATYNSAATPSSPIGNYSIVPTPSGTTLDNYDVTVVNGTLTVDRASLTVTANSTNRVYGTVNPAFTGTISGIKNGEAITATYSCSASIASPAGSYDIVPIPVGSTLSNYSMTMAKGTLTIGRAACSGIVSSSQNPQIPGEAVIFSVVLTPIAPSVGTPTGMMQFRVDGIQLGAPVMLIGGTASFSTSGLSAGTHEVVAEYGGDLNFIGITNSLLPVQLINTPPVAGPDTIERYPTEGATIEISTLLSNDSDPDGDVVSFVDVSATSEQGGSISREGSLISYEPPAGLTNVDTFTYSIYDGLCAPVHGIVSVNVKDDAPGPTLTIVGLGGASYRLSVQGWPDRQCIVQFISALSSSDWTTLTSGTTDAAGLFECVDSAPVGDTARFYRALYP